MSYLPHPMLDRFEAVARLRGWMREMGKNRTDLNAIGVSTSEFAQLLDQGTNGADQNFNVLVRVAEGFKAPLGYLFSGEIPNDLPKKRQARIQIWALIEGFSNSMELSGRKGKDFSVWAMKHMEPRLNEVEFAVYDRGLPQTEGDIAPLYLRWCRERAAR